MKLSISPPPFAGAPVVVLIAGLGGSGSYWLPQLAVLEQEYQVVCYDQRGTGNNPDTLPEDYTLAHMADELALALAGAGIARYCVVGHALGALVGLRLEAEEALALAHFQGKANLLRRLHALKQADFSRHAARVRCPVQIICSTDDLLVPSVCSAELHAALPHARKTVMRQGGHACNVTVPDTFNPLLLNGLASLLHSPEPAL